MKLIRATRIIHARVESIKNPFKNSNVKFLGTRDVKKPQIRIREKGMRKVFKRCFASLNVMITVTIKIEL